MQNQTVQLPFGSNYIDPILPTPPNAVHTNAGTLIPVTLVPLAGAASWPTVTTPCPNGIPLSPPSIFLTPCDSNGFPTAPPSPNANFIMPPPSPTGIGFLPTTFNDFPLPPSPNRHAYSSLSPPGSFAFPQNFNDLYLSPSPDSFSSISCNGSVAESGSELFDDHTENYYCDEAHQYTNIELDEIAAKLEITQNTINGIVLDPSRPRTLVVTPDPNVESLLCRIYLQPQNINENSFTISAKSLENHPSEIHICAEVNGRFVLAKMLSEEIGEGYMNVCFAEEDSQFELTPGEIFVVTSDLENNFDACARPGLRYGLLTTDENHVVRGTLLQPHCVQLIIKTHKALMQVSIFVAKFVSENKNNIIRYGLALSMDGMRLFMHMKDEETQMKFEKLRARFSHLPKSSIALYQADKNLQRAAKHLEEIVDTGYAHLLKNDLMGERFNIDFESPKSAKHLLAYFAKEGGVFPVGTESLVDIKYLELSLKFMNEKKEHFFFEPEDYANRCTKAILGLLNLYSIDVVKVLDKYQDAMSKVISALRELDYVLEEDWRQILPFRICEDTAESIMEKLSGVHYFNSYRRLYFQEKINADGTYVLKTDQKELRKAVNALRNIELQFHNCRMKKLVKPLQRFCCQDDFKTDFDGEKINPFFKKDSSDLDERVLHGDIHAVFQDVGIQDRRSEQHRFALLFENALAEQKTKIDYSEKQMSSEDIWIMLYGRQM